MRQVKLFILLMMLLMSGTIQMYAAGSQKAWSETDGVFYLKTKETTLS